MRFTPVAIDRAPFGLLVPTLTQLPHNLHAAARSGAKMFQFLLLRRIRGLQND